MTIHILQRGRMSLKSLIFDFDGLILDTEMPEYLVLREFFRENGAELPISEYVKCIGSSYEAFNPYVYLEELTGRQFDRASIGATLQAKSRVLIQKQPPLPGVKDLIVSARQTGLRLAVASSSSDEWVTGHLTRLELLPYFDVICTGSQVPRVKPAPDVYQLAIKRLDINPEEAVALEDSINGVNAAKDAGLFCIAVPSALTNMLNFSRADLMISSIADLTLDRLTARFNGKAH
ncbi:MAG TPA: HAD family hydrolase [Anaerolineaceae bacterium]|nr:HAD family hydrolase [Anaerolineaceae bacterium]